MARIGLMAAVVLACAGPAFAQGFKLESADVKPNAAIAEEQVFNGFGCTGKNVSPALKWSGAPKGTKSFALLVHDPDAPTGGAGWWHWVVINIPADGRPSSRRTRGRATDRTCRRAPLRSTRISEARGGAGPARRPATSRIGTTSRCTR